MLLFKNASKIILFHLYSSKQKVSTLLKTPEGETVEEEPFVDHQPPFLALPEVKPIEPLALPAPYAN